MTVYKCINNNKFILNLIFYMYIYFHIYINSVYMLIHSFLNLSVASTKASIIPFSEQLCPASGIICKVDKGNFLCNSQADLAGQTTSYLPCTITVGILAILSQFSSN